MKKGLIFGGIALAVIGGAYIWYKNSLKKISEDFKPEVKPTTTGTKTAKQISEEQLALALSTNQKAFADPNNYARQNYGSLAVAKQDTFDTSNKFQL